MRVLGEEAGTVLSAQRTESTENREQGPGHPHSQARASLRDLSGTNGDFQCKISPDGAADGVQTLQTLWWAASQAQDPHPPRKLDSARPPLRHRAPASV